MSENKYFSKMLRSFFGEKSDSEECESDISNIGGAPIFKRKFYHPFYNEENCHQTHIWRCNGICQYKKPFKGWVRRTSNRSPGPSDQWWSHHQTECGGIFVKIYEPSKLMPLTGQPNKEFECLEITIEEDSGHHLEALSNKKIESDNPNHATNNKQFRDNSDEEQGTEGSTHKRHRQAVDDQSRHRETCDTGVAVPTICISDSEDEQPALKRNAMNRPDIMPDDDESKGPVEVSVSDQPNNTDICGRQECTIEGEPMHYGADERPLIDEAELKSPAVFDLDTSIDEQQLDSDNDMTTCFICSKRLKQADFANHLIKWTKGPNRITFK